MKLTTIWTIPAMSLPERLRRTREWAAFEVARRLPLRVKYWAGMQQIAAASTKDPKKVVPEMDLEYVMKNMPSPKHIA
jgi:hypothetical protein